MGQNYGARAFDRIRTVLTNCFAISGLYVAAVTLLLWFCAPLIVMLFDAKGETATLLAFFCHVAGFLWLFLGGIFVANAAFNNLGHPVLSAGFNWARATLGTVPFVTLGAWMHGPEGGYLGLVVGAAVFGCLAVAWSYVVVGRIAERPAPAAAG